MQKDVHFYLTYALARKAGIASDDAEKIAWADQYTDDLTKAELHGIQTQSAIIGNWSDKQIQRSVLVPFHFIPGDNAEHPWMVTANSKRAQKLVKAALSDKFQFGIALHTLQDTFSHQGWMGWDEKFNACFPWFYIQSGIPNIGHAEMQAVPDIANVVWTDPRTGQQIDNKERVLDCAWRTWLALLLWPNHSKERDWNSIIQQLEEIVTFSQDYDERKEQLRKLSGSEKIRYSSLNEKFQPDYKQQFIKAANQHLAAALELMKDLPGPGQSKEQ